MPKRSKSQPKNPFTPIDPTWIIGEVLGESACHMRNPENAENRCPFISGDCIKRSHNLNCPLPVCSIYRNPHCGQNKSLSDLITICPKRLFEADIQNDIIEHCWFHSKPQNPITVHEVKMGGFGTVDIVIADIDPKDNTVREFVSAEMQAVDITRSYADAYIALTNKQMLDKPVPYGFNWKNVYKRYVMQLIDKGFYHHHWNTHIVSVLQKPVFEKIKEFINFSQLTLEKSNIIFLVYEYVLPDDKDGAALAKLKLCDVVGTNHSSLMTGSLYKQPPAKEEFCKRILARCPSE